MRSLVLQPHSGHLGWAPFVAVDGQVQAAHGQCIEPPFEGCQRCRAGGAFCPKVTTYHQRRVVRWEEVAVVGQDRETECIDEAIGGVAGDQVDLARGKGTIRQSQIHRSRRLGEMESVELQQSIPSIRPFDELVAEAGAERRADPGEIGDGLQR